MAENGDELSYEDISEIWRKERNITSLTEIRSDFYKAASALIKKNNDARNKLLVENPDMWDGLSNRYKNMAKLLEEIVHYRTCKIWMAALRCARSESSAQPENMTEEEKTLFDSVLEIGKRQFALVYGEKKAYTMNIDNIHEMKGASTVVNDAPSEAKDVEAKKGPVAEDKGPQAEVKESEVPDVEKMPEPLKNIPPMEDTIIDEEEVVIRVLSDIPTFSGPERDYTLKKEDVVRLPSIMASALINRKMAVLVKTTT